MNSFRNNHKRNRFRSNGDRNFRKRNGDSQKFNSDYSTNINFKRGVTLCDFGVYKLKRAEVEYETIQVTTQEMNALYPKATSYPYVIIDGEEIGGLVEAAKHFIKEGLVSARKD